MEKGCAIVVGAGSGTGAALAKAFAKEGYGIAVARRNADALMPLVTEIEQRGGRTKAFGMDASDESDVIALFDNSERALGPVEVAVFNAAGITRGSILETTTDDFTRMTGNLSLAVA